MTEETVKKYLNRLWIVILKIWDSFKWGLSMLHPDKTASSKICFGMALICVIIFILNTLFTLFFTGGHLIYEFGRRADKEMKVAKMVYERELLDSDSVSTDLLFQKFQDAGIDSTYIICVTDSANKLVTSTNKSLSNDSIDFSHADEEGWFLNMDEMKIQYVIFSANPYICLSDTLLAGTSKIRLIEPMEDAFNAAADVVKKVGLSSFICFFALLLCYLVMLFLLRRTTTRNTQIEGEIDVAAKIQKQMVPLDFSAFPEKHGYNLSGILQPAKTMGGDLLDYVLHKDKLFFCIGDVSGKSMPAALFMSEVHVLFHHVLAHTSDPADMCSAINNSLAEGNKTNMFCTFFVGVIDFETHVLSYCNAGHNPPVLLDCNGKAEFLKTESNIALGLLNGFPYEAQQIGFPAGTTLVTYTDGVTEAESLDKQFLGDDALLRILSGRQGLAPIKIISATKKKINEHTLLAEQSDDITMLVLKHE